MMKWTSNKDGSCQIQSLELRWVLGGQDRRAKVPQYSYVQRTGRYLLAQSTVQCVSRSTSRVRGCEGGTSERHLKIDADGLAGL